MESGHRVRLGPDPVDRTVIPELRLRSCRSNPDAPTGPGAFIEVAPEVLLDRIEGAIVGAAVGDALGAPFEFDAPGTFSSRLPDRRADGQGDMIGGGAFDWAPGEFTDDTQMALALAVSLIHCDGYDPDDVWRRWQEWARTARDIGGTIHAALQHADWRDVHHLRPERTASNGALMRAFPLAPASVSRETATVRRVTLHQALLTHAHPAAAWGAWLAVAMTRAGILGEDPFETLEGELAQLERVDALNARRFITMLDTSWEPGRAVDGDIGNGSVWGCLAQAVWALRRRDAFADVLADVIDLGGDTDTVACVAGALAGARGGASTIPVGWTAPVNGVLSTPAGTEHYTREGLAMVAQMLTFSTD